MDYLMELESDALLQNFTQEAGRYQNFGSKKLKHGGWEDPSCQLRGHFLGHWLSAAAIHYDETGNQALLGKANEIVHELRLCQLDNGGEWAASIPEKYFHWIAIKKQVWAPHYNVHKTFMGLIDMYLYAKNEEALTIAIDFSKWFLRYTDNRTREQLDDILDFETGGMLEIWAQLYDITKDNMYLTLIERYDRHRLFDPLLAGEDVLTNMHANTTIPEIIGCAAVYEATKITRYRDIVLAYWKCAVTDRGYFVTGGQTNGEIWTPKASPGIAPWRTKSRALQCVQYDSSCKHSFYLDWRCFLSGLYRKKSVQWHPCASLLEGGSSKWSDIFLSIRRSSYIFSSNARWITQGMGFQNTRLLLLSWLCRTGKCCP